MAVKVEPTLATPAMVGVGVVVSCAAATVAVEKAADASGGAAEADCAVVPTIIARTRTPVNMPLIGFEG